MKIKFAHVRPTNYFVAQDDMGPYLSGHKAPKGGKTIAYVVDDDYNVIGYAVAKCSKRDFYCKRTGRELAKERLKDEKSFIEIPAMSEQEFIDACHASVY